MREIAKCDKCEGTGIESEATEANGVRIRVTCPGCAGTGRMVLVRSPDGKLLSVGRYALNRKGRRKLRAQRKRVDRIEASK